MGGRGGAYFPVLPFYVYFVAEVYAARKKLSFDWKALLVSIGGTAYMIIDMVFLTKSYPSRFPLSLAWLVGATFILYLYYLASGYFSQIKTLSVVLEVGKLDIL